MGIGSTVVSIPLTTGTVDTYTVLRAPTGDQGGAITILGAEIVNHATTSGTATFTAQLLSYSNAGTPAVNGTVGATIGGTADHWTDNVPKAFTIGSGAEAVLAAGEYLVVNIASVDTGTPTRPYLMLRYRDGK